jgi:hypothetical protein
MSDNSAIRRYHRQTVPASGTTGKKPYGMIIMILLAAGLWGTLVLIHHCGILV